MNHTKSNKNMVALSAINNTPLIEIFNCTNGSAASKFKGSVTMFLSCHCAIANCDHISYMLKNNLSDNKVIDDVKMHHSKCTNIIIKSFVSPF